jgi:IS605 OrfB family transposase
MTSLMIRWWNSSSIPVAQTLWKPGIVPIRSYKQKTNSWYKASTQVHEDINQSMYETYKPNEEIVITRKIKMNPTHEQKVMLTSWWDAYRYSYNKAIENMGSQGSEDSREVVIHLDVKEDGVVKLDLGQRFEMETKWKIDLEYIEEPKIKLKINVSKKKEHLSVKINIISDPVITPVKVNFHFEYPIVASWQTLRNEIVTSKYHQSTKNLEVFQNMTKEEIFEANLKPDFKKNRWLLDVDKRIRAGAVKDARANYETICTLAKDYNRKGTLGSLSFKRKRNESWTISMEKSCIEPCKIKSTRVGRKGKQRKRKKTKFIQGFYVCKNRLKTPIRCFEKINDEFGDPKIHKDSYGDWWLLLPIRKKNKIEESCKPAISLDPGIKTFQTGYTTNGRIKNFVEDNDVISTLLKRISYLDSQINANREKSKNTKYIIKLRKEMQNKIHDMHFKVINDLCKNYNLIVLGKLHVKNILESSTITKAAKRKLQALSHYSFKCRLQYKASCLGVRVHSQNEWGTTKGCPCCGKSNDLNLSNRIYECPKCLYSGLRDDKAACCIMLKYLAKVY